MGNLRLPPGKRIAVNLGVDFDAQCVWLGTFGFTSPAYMHRGEFGAKVGAPRLLDLFERYAITTTWCIPGHTIETFGDEAKQIQAAGHEIAHHGYYHENPTTLRRDEEQRLMELAFDAHERVLGQRPRGFRSPYWDFSENTLELLEQAGFEYDSSLMARDFTPYRPHTIEVNWESPNRYGPESSVLEIPTSWALDDWPPAEFVTGVAAGLAGTDVSLSRWKTIFDFAYEHAPGGCYVHTCHPQVTGRAHQFVMYEQLVDYIAHHDGVWFATLGEISDAWSDDEPLEAHAPTPAAAREG